MWASTQKNTYLICIQEYHKNSLRSQSTLVPHYILLTQSLLCQVREHQHQLAYQCSPYEKFVHTWSVKLNIMGIWEWGIYDLRVWLWLKWVGQLWQLWQLQIKLMLNWLWSMLTLGWREFRQFEGKTKSPAAARNQTLDTWLCSQWSATELWQLHILLQQMHISVTDVYEDLWSKDFHRLGTQVKYDSSRRIRVRTTHR